MRACRHKRKVSITKSLLPGKTHIEGCRETLSFFLIVSLCAWMCVPAFMCVHCACVSLYKHSPPYYSWLVDGCWLSHLHEFVPARCGRVTGKAPKHSSILTIVQRSVGSLPVVSNIHLVAADTGKSAYAHRNQVAKPTDLCCRPALAVTYTGSFWRLYPPLLSSSYLHWQIMVVAILIIIIIRWTETVGTSREDIGWMRCYLKPLNSGASNPNRVGRAWGSLANQFCVNGWNCWLIFRSEIKCMLLPIKPLQLR